MNHLYPFSRTSRQRAVLYSTPIGLSDHPGVARSQVRSVRVSYRDFRREGCTPKIARLAAIGLHTWTLDFPAVRTGREGL